MDYRHICTAGMVTRHDLITAHEALESGPESLSMRMVLLRHIMLEIANVADISIISRGLFQLHPELGSLHQPIAKSLEFFKYLRNKYIGHFVPELTDKAFEWLPFSYHLIGSEKTTDQGAISWFALETAINTYTDAETKHRIFDGDIDLNYPPDCVRFLNYLGETAIHSIAFISHLIEVTRDYLEVPDMEREGLELAMKAGGTEFSYLAKGKR